MTQLPFGRPLTCADLDRMPDDGHRYELLDGVLVVSPAPRPLHQRAVSRLTALLLANCPADLEVLAGPVDVRLADDTLVQPDLIVARPGDLTDRGLAGPPLLAVEVLSPGNRGVDLVSKRARYESEGCPSYWIIDPDLPSLLPLELGPDGYRDATPVTGGGGFAATAPFAVTVRPAELVAG